MANKLPLPTKFLIKASNFTNKNILNEFVNIMFVFKMNENSSNEPTQAPGETSTLHHLPIQDVAVMAKV